tara:strand:- start:3877 stop:4794 length:918 start_codon:yes stop_codon:yes gene_type:complete
MYKLILGSTLGLITLTHASQIGGEQQAVNRRRCGSGLKLFNIATNSQWGSKKGSGNTDHDFYGDGTVKYEIASGATAWSTLVGEFPGIDTACEKFNTVLDGIASDFEEPANPSNQYVSSPHSWKRAVTLKLHDAGCAISPNDNNLEQFLEAFNYPHQQKMRMSKAARASDEYLLKIQGLQDEWKEARQNFVQEMKAHGAVMKHKLKESSKEAGLRNYQAATDALLSEQEGSARVEIGKVRGTISKNGEVFEELAQKFKRDGLRWSKLNQISKEQERLSQMTTIVRLNAFDVLSQCLTNYQKEFVD